MAIGSRLSSFPTSFDFFPGTGLGLGSAANGAPVSSSRFSSSLSNSSRFEPCIAKFFRSTASAVRLWISNALLSEDRPLARHRRWAAFDLLAVFGLGLAVSVFKQSRAASK
jgi:hypothetical protein